MNTNLVHGIHVKFKQLQLLALPMQEKANESLRESFGMG